MPQMTAPTTRRQTWRCSYLSRLVVPRRAWNAARQLWRKQNQCHCAHSANRGTKHKRPDENHTHVHTQRETRTQHAATKGLQQPRPSCSHPLPLRDHCSSGNAMVGSPSACARRAANSKPRTWCSKCEWRWPCDRPYCQSSRHCRHGTDGVAGTFGRATRTCGSFWFGYMMSWRRCFERRAFA